jgi:PHP family Zn ribbon phosphoesterase
MQNPYWSDKEKKHVIVEFIYEDGNRQIASIVGDDDGTNPDYVELLEKYTIEHIDANTKKRNDERHHRIRQNQERQKIDKQRSMQEMLFAAKLDAFEIDAIKSSTNRTLKSKIRKAKTPMEVTAYTVMLLMQEEANTAIVGEAVNAE